MRLFCATKHAEAIKDCCGARRREEGGDVMTFNRVQSAWPLHERMMMLGGDGDGDDDGDL